MSEKSDGEQEPVGKQPAAATTAAAEEKEEQRLSDDPAEVAKRERNKKYFAALSCEKVLELLDALKLSKYKQSFEEEGVDGDLLITSCDDKELEDTLGVSSRLHRRKLMRLINGEYSAEDIFKPTADTGTVRPKHPPDHDSNCGGSPSHLHGQEQAALQEHFRSPVREGMIQEAFEVLTPDDIPVDIVSGIPDTRLFSGDTPKGLRFPQNRSITVCFHVLVATEAWQWDNSTSHAHIRFGHHELGNWKVNCGEAVFLRDVDENLTEIVFTLPIDKSILENETPLPYAYAIYSGSLETIQSPLERLYGAPHRPTKGGKEDFATRCLVIPRREHLKNEFHQYDTICYPDQQKFEADTLSQLFIKAWNRMRPKTPANTSYTVDSPEKMTKKCLEVYLSDYCNTLTGYDTSEAMRIEKTVDEIMHIYKCLSDQLLHYINSKGYGNMPRTDSEKVMQDWLLQISRSQGIPPNKCLSSAAVIILCLQQLSTDCIKSLPIHAMCSLLKFLTLSGSKRTRQCPGYEHLRKCILTDKHMTVLSNAIGKLCNTVMKSKGTEAVEWFQALPVQHFLEGSVQPFGDLNFKTFLKLDFRKDYRDMRKAIEAKYTDSNSDEGFFDRYYAAVQHLDLLEADPLLAVLFIYICPTRELPRLFSLVSPYLAVMGVAKLIRDFLQKPPLQNMTVLFKTIIDDVRTSTLSVQLVGNSKQERLRLIQACQWVFMEVIEILESTSQHCVELVNAAVFLVLHGLAQLRDADSEKEKEVVFQKLSTTLKNWVSKHLSVSTLKNPKLAKAREHIKLWDLFLQLDCPRELRNDWEHAVDGIMKECIDQVDDEMKVNLVCVPELDSDNTKVCTSRSLEFAAARAILAMDPAVAVKNAKKILSSQLKHATAVFKIVLEERCKENMLALTDLLEWKLWPCLIKHYGTHGCTEIMENPKEMSSIAQMKVRLYHEIMENGEITIQDLMDIRENREQMKQLLSAASIKKLVMDKRLLQLEYIQFYHKQLYTFYQHHSELDYEGIVKLKEDVSIDLQQMKLKDVINIDSEPPVFSCLKSTLHLQKFFKDFCVLTVKHSSDLFLKLWQEKIEEKRKHCHDLEALMEQVWHATFQRCETVLSHLHNGAMRTTDVEELFKEKDDVHIQQEIAELFHGFNKCKQIHETDGWIEKVVKRIIIHRSLQQYSETAKHFLLLKECLKLTGDFREVKVLSDQASQTAKRKCLRDINPEIIEAGNTLKAIAECPENLQCLQAFLECREFRAWLVTAFKDVADLRNFVLVAVATGTGGEDELTLQKFSNLELVGSVFGPLIYELKKDSGSDALFDAWERVWKGAQKNKRMKAILVDLNKEVEWFKEVKNSHGSVESTSYGQMESSIKCGVYHIGTAGKHSAEAPRIEICLKEERGKTYSLEELRDLESRLVLMGGNTSTSQDGATAVTENEKGKKVKIEDFLKVFRKVCQVADLVVELQCEGHVKYIEWHQRFPCSSKHINIELQELAEEMKNDLMMWKEEVTKQRRQFYELNNYTTLQLLHLRQELCNASAFSSKVLVLLSSISSEVQRCNVMEALQCVMSSVQPQDGGSPSTIQSVQKQNHLELPELGQVLKKLREQLPAPVNKSRKFPSEFLQIGSPNLLIIHPDDVLKTVISIYMRDETLPLPTMEEVLLCTDATTTEEVILLWRRAVYDPGYKRIFCLVNPEKLSYSVADKAFHELNQILQFATEEKKRPDYRLIIMCGSESTQRSHAVSKLEKYQRAYCKVTDEECSVYLRNQYTKYSERGCVGMSKSRVRVVKSMRGGLGKSFYIQRLTEMFPGNKYTIIPIHGPVVTAGTVMKQLKDHGSDAAVFHIDVAPSVLHKVDTVLFGLLILGGLSDSHGRVWRCNRFQKFAVEVTETSKKVIAASFLRMVPTVECISPEQHLESTHTAKLGQNIAPLDAVEFHTPSFQRVYQYLRRYDGGESLDGFTYPDTVEGTSDQCLQILTKYCGQKDPSWSEIKHFVFFLNKQMKSCESSVYLNLGGCPGFKHFVVKFMITMSKDFATSSLRCELDRESKEQPPKSDALMRYEIDKRRKWEQSAHPYLLFNEDGHSITFVGFRISVVTGDLLHPGSATVLIRRAVTNELLEFLKLSGVDLDEQWKHWSKETMITKLATVMGIRVGPDVIYDPDLTYELTTDNLIKMLAIQMRFRSNIPVILMGETGCGKTRLIKYMCQLAKQDQKLKNFFMLKVHGGTADDDILRVIQKAVEEAPKNVAHGVYTVVFFDEANTTEALGLIKEVMCDHRAYGKKIPDSIKLVAACNPYRRHTDEMISNLQSAGLGFHVDVKDTKDRFGDIPLRELVYRVLDLPPSMRPLVYDFGQLNPTAEKDYVCHIVHNHVKQTLQNMKLTRSENLEMIGSAISSTLSWCQSFMRQRKDECSFVSLRDVERTMMVFDYFYKMMDKLAPEIEKKKSALDFIWSWTTKNLSPECRALVLAISVCYNCRLRNRDGFEEQVVKQLKDTKCKRFEVHGGVKQFREEVMKCQEIFLNNMKIGNNIARNKALRENVFMMVVCIELRIPLFVVGKPGSSKSLAKTIVHDSMTGQASGSKFMREFKQVHMFSYQCSQLSTSESIIQVFNSAKKYQSKQNMEHFVSVVVLDEVGLAEDSPSLPLKALHPLLEDGTEGGNDSEEVVPLKERVAFIGISNWALDPAKMNRGIMVVRTDPDTDELVQSARGICSNEENDPVRERLKRYFEQLAEAYQEVVTKQKREFYGLRDFYSLIKMLYWKCKTLNGPINPNDLQYAIKRNFDSFGKFDDTLSCFYRKLHIQNVTDASCSAIRLIEDSLKSRDISWHGENRYLLLLTENYAALNAILSVLHQLDSEIEPYVLFGSGFPKDKEFTQVCCNISRIKHCMQTGRTVILLNLENLYESLYDLLNQYYTEHGGHRFVDLGLQCHRMKCQVHRDFKVIVIAEEETVYEHFPTPLINRLEKHRIVMESILEPWKLEILREFRIWIDKFTSITASQSSRFRPEDAFVGYHKDIPATVLYQAFELARQQTEYVESSVLDTESEERKSKYKEDVLRHSKYFILQTATPDALIRLRKTGVAEEEQQQLTAYYFKSQRHSSLTDFLLHQLIENQPVEPLFMQVTTHSHLPSSSDYENISKQLDGMNIICLFLQEFDTELDFTNKISNIIRTSVFTTTMPVGVSDIEREAKPSDVPTTESINGQSEGSCESMANDGIIEAPDPQQSDEITQAQLPLNKNKVLIVVQCDAAFTHGSLIACGRYRIYDVVNEEIKRAKENADENFRVHILYVIHVPRRIVSSSFTGFQPKPWLSYHIDSLLPSFGELPLQLDQMLDQMKITPLSELFRATSHRLSSLIPMASSTVHDSANSMRSTCRLRVLIAMVMVSDDSNAEAADKERFCSALNQHVCSILTQHDEEVYSEREWILNEALSPRQLQRGGTLQSTLYGKLDDVVVPILAEIIAFIDRNYNLSLICDPNLSKLWLDILCNSQICRFKYKELFPERLGKQKKEVPGIGARRCSTDFQCKFPFSWIVKESIDVLLNQTLHLAESKTVDLHAQVCQLIEQSPVGDVLKKYSVSESSMTHLLEDGYLHDFIRMSYAPKHTAENEYQLLTKAIDQAAQDQHLYRDSIVSRLAAVHVVFHSVRKEVLWFGQLVEVNPRILKPLISASASDENRDMVLHLMAVGETLKMLDATMPLKPGADAQKNAYVWLQFVYACQRGVHSALHLPINTPQSNELASKLSLQWQRQQAVQLFIEHFILQHPNLVSYAEELNETLRTGSSDFTRVIAIEAVVSVLSSLSDDHKQRSTVTYETSWIQQTSYAFFTEVVSYLCFGWKIPQDEVIHKLMSIAFPEGASSLPYLGVELDGIPIIRPFLLHLLLKQDFQKCESYLEKYFESHGDKDQDILLQCIQGFEDSYHQQMSELPHQQRVQETLKHIKEAHEEFTGSGSEHTPSSLRSVRAVARLRFGLSVVAHALYSLTENDANPLDEYSGILLQAAREVCTDVHINEVDTGPAVFLIKQIIKQYGTGCFMTLAKKEAYSWILPERLYPPEEDKGVDPFVIYGQPYSDIRKGVSLAVRGIGIDLLDSSVKQHDQQGLLLQLALYERATLMARKHQHIYEDGLQMFEQYIRGTALFSGKEMCLKLLRNNLPATSHLRVTRSRSPLEKLLGEVVIHVTLVLMSMKDLQILHPLVAMLHDPGSLKNCYLPTMPEDALSEARKALPGTYYECPRGHPYLIGNCGRPRTKANCSECGLPIGGLNYQLSKANKRLEEGHDDTKRGYLLQKPLPRSKAPLSVRGLNPASCLIIRILMHSALLWASASGGEVCIRGMQQIMRTSVKDDKLTDFFWNHLLRDIKLLHKATGKSIDDVALLMHLLLKKIAVTSSPRAVTPPQLLLSTEARAQWETDLTVTYIQPVLQSLDQKLKTALDYLSQDAKEEKDLLFVVVNEMTTDSKSLTHNLWSYRPRITLGHLKQSLQQTNMQKRCPILDQFLNEEPSLRATKYLPEIVQLQYLLYDKYNYRMDQKVAQATTVAQFLADVNLSSEELSKKYRYLILECLKKAWRLVREELPQHTRLRVDGENLMSDVTMETRLDYLIPTTSGHGRCTTALVDYLVQTHNAFIERCQAIAQEKQTRKSDWKKLQVPITHINHCHLIDHEEQLYPIILSHCRYSLKAGHGQEVQYDFPALEKHILKRFIFGKPTILLDIPQVAYQKDVYASVTFQRVREVIKQVPMPSDVKRRVLGDTWTNQQLRKTTDVLEVALGFMSSGAGSANMALSSFVQDTLQIKLDSSIKLPDCSLEHTISLWKVLSVKLCKTLTLADEEPFDVEGEALLQQLSEEQTTALDAALQRFNLNQLLESLLEFTLIFAKYMSADQLQNWPIVGTLEPFLDDQGLPEIPNFDEKFPEDIVVGQTIAVWKHIVEYQKRNSTHDTAH